MASLRSDDSDDALIALVRDKDKAAMRRLYERHAAGLQSFIAGKLGDRLEAADIVQDVFMEVWRHAGRFQHRSSVKSWMYSIARNKTVDHIRKSSRTDVQPPDETLPDEGPDPHAVLQASQDAIRLRACVDKLSEAQRSAVTLAYFQDLTYREIAEIEGVREGTVKTRVHHAKQLLMHCLTRVAGR